MMAGVTPRRSELASFLRNRRESLTPEGVGLPHRARRRTPGLRREEVAERAAISAALYSWLEQGRDVPVSTRTVEGLTRALELSRAESKHLQLLTTPAREQFDDTVTPALERFVDSLRTHPAWILNHAWNVVYRNAAAEAVFGRAAAAGSNYLESLFLDAAMRSLLRDWDAIVSDAVDVFRYDFAAAADDPESIALVERVRNASATFREKWAMQRVRPQPDAVWHIDHPSAGEIVLEPSSFAPVGSTGIRILQQMPVDDDAARKIAQLLATSPGRRG